MSRAVKRLTQGHRTNPGMSRLLKNLLFLIITWHWMGCAYWFVADMIGFGSQWTPDPTMNDADLSLKYLQAFYWSLAATTSVGKNLQPFDSVTTWFTLTMVVNGVIIMAFVIGSSSIALEDLDAADNEKRSRIEAINNFLAEMHDMDARLKKKIVNYYDYVLTRSAGLELLDDLHTTLKGELTWNLHANLIMKVPIFDGLSQECISAIIRELTPKTFLPKEYICLQGERMTMMFFILSGRVAVVDITTKNMKPVTILKDGGFFGERCVIDNSRMKETMQAVSYCDILLLHKQQIKRLIRYHIDFLIAIHRQVHNQEIMPHWQKIQFVLNNCRMLHLLGNDITFEELYPQFNFINISKSVKNI